MLAPFQSRNKVPARKCTPALRIQNTKSPTILVVIQYVKYFKCNKTETQHKYLLSNIRLKRGAATTETGITIEYI